VDSDRKSLKIEVLLFLLGKRIPIVRTRMFLQDEGKSSKEKNFEKFTRKFSKKIKEIQLEILQLKNSM